MDFLSIVDVAPNGPFFIESSFQRKFAQPAPEGGVQLVTFYHAEPLRYIPLGYLHLSHHESVILVGGGLTDGRAFQYVDPEHARQIRESGGVLYRALRHAFTEYADQCEAFFGHCGDARAKEVDLAAGFEETRHEFLLAHFHKPLPAERRDQLIDAIHAIGAF